MKYKKIVQEIKDLPWSEFDPYSIVFLSFISAVEFANSLRSALVAYPTNKNLAVMAEGELQTNNLTYEDYTKKGDHSAFLSHFIYGNPEVLKADGPILNKKLRSAGYAYNNAVYSLGNSEAKAMTIFSREQELPDIFKNILDAHNWEDLNLGFYKYYLWRHIELDSADGGHADLTKDFHLDEAVLEKFYIARLKFYKALY